MLIAWWKCWLHESYSRDYTSPLPLLGNFFFISHTQTFLRCIRNSGVGEKINLLSIYQQCVWDPVSSMGFHGFGHPPALAQSCRACRRVSALAPGETPAPPAQTWGTVGLFPLHILIPLSSCHCIGVFSLFNSVIHHCWQAQPWPAAGPSRSRWHWLHRRWGKLLAAFHWSHACSPPKYQNLAMQPPYSS